MNSLNEQIDRLTAHINNELGSLIQIKPSESLFPWRKDLYLDHELILVAVTKKNILHYLQGIIKGRELQLNLIEEFLERAS